MIQRFQRFISELQRRKMLRVAATYLVGAWIVLQVAVALQTAMSLSASFSAAILALLVIGFPASLVLTWFFEITPDGIKRTAPATGDGTLVKPHPRRRSRPCRHRRARPNAEAEPDRAPAATTAEAPRLGDKSIAVLPFKNLSPDKDDAYFADGLTEETLNVLAQVPGLKVISRTSSETFKGKDTPLPDIAKTLGVRYHPRGQRPARRR